MLESGCHTFIYVPSKYSLHVYKPTVCLSGYNKNGLNDDNQQAVIIPVFNLLFSLRLMKIVRAVSLFGKTNIVKKVW